MRNHDFVLGVGQLTWSSAERRSDRYGSVALEAYTSWNNRTVRRILGRNGTLHARVLATQDSEPLGDFFRPELGQAKSPILIGDEYLIGEGKFFMIEECLDDGISPVQVGLRPLESRRNDWLDADILHRLHHQSVVLIFREVSEPV